MAKPSIPNQRKQYKELEKRVQSYVLLIEDIYESLSEEAADIALKTGFDPKSDRPFKFSDYPAASERVRTLQSRMADEIEAVIYRGTSAEWAASNEVQNLLATGVLKEYTGVIDRQKYRVLFQENSDALRAFRDRVDNGMTISDKLWSQSGSMRAAMEEAISCAIRKGTSAVTLSKRISQYLQDYPKLARDYGKKYGVAATAGDCEYRSIRLAASEINMAYRNAENERWAQMDFVVGYEIRLSSNHNCKGVPRGSFYDICDELAGKYPKDFKWSGWHPLCRCYKIPILKTEEEFWEWDGRSEVSGRSVNEVRDVPDNFKTWVNNNQSRINKSEERGTLPYFLRDNQWALNQVKSSGIGEIRYKPPKLEDVAKGCRDGVNIELLTDNKYHSFEEYISSLGMSSEEAKRKLNSVLNDSDVYMSIDFNTLTNRIIKGDGYFKSSIETGKGTFKTIGEERAVKERSIFGILEDCPLDEYPKYGFLSSKGQMTYEPISGWGYGDTYVRFKKNNVAPRSTFTIGDSYDGNVLFDKKRVLMAKENYEQVLKYTDASNVKAINEVKEKIAECDKILKAKYNVYRKCTPASPVNDPGLESLLHFSGNKNAASKIKEILDSGIDSLGEMSGTYVECQIYGKVSISDVSSIEISSKKQRDTLLKLLKKNNLDIDVVPCKFDSRISLLERSFTDYDDVPTRFCLSLTNKDIDNLGDYYIDGLCGRFADSRNSFWKEIKMDDTFNSLLDKVSKNKASISEKREYIKLYLSEIRKKGAGQFPKVWWENYRPKLGGWTDDVLNEELLKR